MHRHNQTVSITHNFLMREKKSLEAERTEVLLRAQLLVVG